MSFVSSQDGDRLGRDNRASRVRGSAPELIHAAPASDTLEGFGDTNVTNWPECHASVTKRRPSQALVHSPKSGMPYLVVTLSPEGVTATAVESNEWNSVLRGHKFKES
jgi:hypothetical protein